jgi:hypothetical protein
MKRNFTRNGIHWAESLLERQTVSRTKILKFIRLAAGIFFLATVPLAEGATISACGKATGETLYSAIFKWSGEAQSGKTMRIVIVKAKKPGFKDSKIVAKILNGKNCEAVCNVEKLETFGTEKSLKAASVDMSCKSAALGALAAPATVFFQNESNPFLPVSNESKSVLRFGTWLQGYEQAVLTTEVDESARLIPELAPTRGREMARSSAEAVKLARTR